MFISSINRLNQGKKLTTCVSAEIISRLIALTSLHKELHQHRATGLLQNDAIGFKRTAAA